MVQPLHMLKETPSQTAGPYVHIGLAPSYAGFDIFENNFSNEIVGPDTKGERITLQGRVFDGSGTPIRDVLLESWQANSEGKYNHPEDFQAKEIEDNFRGWGRICSDFDTGVYQLKTIKPGKVPGRNGAVQAPHISLWIVSRGINIGLSTRVYFSDETTANATDPVLNGIELVERRQTLIAKRNEADGEVVYTFDIYLQGDNETVFFDI
ncbi:protocatechuate 3,4-dioxygenase subunit alpha [Roseibium limicola]|uniref:Protocatechuate 3,4-dioxygenase subunit alpha n=1 Tax=Roseibium limicola TaxID=2816037 RepID=A0A939EP65_9HYPH|nr:protocatechuate 3,4-dioxygenase subunit alpha [Roseibium limicola]MBO0346139.1 protocatechuate 3,4-dioxygenase subunit alpha [Roseibium limicola]